MSDESPTIGKMLRSQPGARFLVVAACLVVVVHGLTAFAPILVPMALAGLLAIVSFPIVYWLQRLRVPPLLGILVSVLVNAGIIALMILLTARAAADLEHAIPDYSIRLRKVVVESYAWLEAHKVPMRDIVTLDAIDPRAVFTLTQQAMQKVLGLLSSTFLVVLLLVFMLAEAVGLPAKLRLLMSEKDIGRAQKITTEVFRYLIIKTLISALTGLLVGIGVALVGLDFPILWGLLAFGLNFIPTIGSIVAGIPPVLLALIVLGWGPALAVAAIYLTVNMTLGNFIEPSLQAQTLGISTLVVILSLLFWGYIWGPIGMLLSVPLTMVVRILLENTDDLRWVAVLISQPPGAEARPIAQAPGTILRVRGRSNEQPASADAAVASGAGDPKGSSAKTIAAQLDSIP